MDIKEMRMLNVDRLSRMIDYAKGVSAIYESETLMQKARSMKLHLRVSGSGIRMVSVGIGSEQDGFRAVKQNKEIKQCKPDVIANWIATGNIEALPPKRPTPEKKVQSFLTREALYGSVNFGCNEFRRIVAIEDCVQRKIDGLGSNVYFVTDELALMKPQKSKIVYDVLGMRVDSQGRCFPMLIELKYGRKKTELLNQLKTYADVFEEFHSFFRELYEVLLCRKLSFERNRPEQWLVWPHDNKDVNKFNQSEIGNPAEPVFVIGYTTSDKEPRFY